MNVEENSHVLDILACWKTGKITYGTLKSTTIDHISDTNALGNSSGQQTAEIEIQ